MCESEDKHKITHPKPVTQYMLKHMHTVHVCSGVRRALNNSVSSFFGVVMPIICHLG